MSLSNALLLDPSTFQVWVAYRTDGVLGGSGTIADPYDASTRWGTPVNRSAGDFSNTGQEATVQLATGHGLANNDVITVSGVTGLGAPAWNGTFTVYSVGANSLKYSMTKVPAAAAAGSAITLAKVLSYRFDELMSEFPSNVTIHLSPTPAGKPFLTRGYADGVAGGWQPKPGCRILGSGVDVTTVQLAPFLAGTFFAVGHPLGASANVDFFEMSDLTVDCNLTGLNADAAAGAVRVMGNHVAIKRTKGINWGTKSAGRAGNVFSIIVADPAGTNKEVANAGIEACIATTPQGTTTAGSTTVFSAGPASVGVSENYGVAPYIRNCFADCDSADHTCEFRGIVMSACRGGVVEGNQIHNTEIGGPYQTTGSTQELIVRNNFYKNVRKALYCSLATVVPGSPTALSSLARDAMDNSIAVAELSAHGLKQSERVKVDASGGSPSQFKGVFVIKDVLTVPDRFRYQMTSAPGGDATSGTFQKVYGVATLLFDANTVELATGSTGQIAIHIDAASLSPETPDYAYGEVIIRRNRIRYVDLQLETSYTGTGIDVKGIKHLFVQDNVIECAPADPIKYTRCGVARFFNDRTPAGVLIRGVDGTFRASELETDADDALLLALY